MRSDNKFSWIMAGAGPRLWVVLVLGAVCGAGLTLLVPAGGGQGVVEVASQQERPAAAPPQAHSLLDDDPPARVLAGPWGILELTPILLVAPEGIVAQEPCPTFSPRWQLPRHTQAELEALFDAAALTPEQRAEARSFSTCAPGGGCTLTPSQSFIGGLSQAARGEIYRKLSVHTENFLQYTSHRWRPQDIDPWFQRSELSESARTQMRALLYQHSDVLWGFADVTYLCGVFGPEDRRGFLRALHSDVSLDARLRIPPGTDVERLVRYWSTSPSHERTIRPMLETLAQAHFGSLDVALLLPPLPRSRLQTYPTGRDRELLNCFWSALNFTADEPDSELMEPYAAVAELRRRYDEVRPGEEPRLGDVLTIQRTSGELLHTSVHVAGGIYFTKNGRSHMQPWILWRKQQLLELYPALEGIREVSYRLRSDRMLAQGGPSGAR